ncbi:MAG: Na/Pi cotransporter family protein [Clostridiales bacterium]|nr:Na/Pi cotransporter family protein [Clostridiales bacterium]
MNEKLQIIFGLIGGLAMFLFGMNSMSAALQKAAGEKMKSILNFLTKNPVMGAVAGMIVTAVLQSSSATTVMAIGFVSAGLMSLPQAISVIFGANIGTTMTAQLLAFKLSNYIYPIIFAGFIINFVCKREKLKNIGMVIFSFGLLFEGIEIMGGVMKPLASSPFFVDLMGKVSGMPVLGVLLGMVMTLVVQSSSATIAVLQNFASQPAADGISSVIGLTGAIPILLGDNIGTTITALLACIGQSKNAKRTALAHSIFNISGSIVFLFLIPVLARFVTMISPSGNEIDVISRQIANAHTTFNIVCTLVWLPLLPVMVKIVTFIVRGKDVSESEGIKTRYIDEKLIHQPTAAMYMISLEISRLSDYTTAMINSLRSYITDKTTSAANEFADLVVIIKSLCTSITNYTTKLISEGGLTISQADQTAGLLFVTNHIERIADRSSEMEKIYRNNAAVGKSFSEEAVEGLKENVDLIGHIFYKSIEALKNGGPNTAEVINSAKEELRKEQRILNKAHILRVKDGRCSPASTSDYAAILYELERAADDCVSIAEEALETVSFAELQSIANGSEPVKEENNDDKSE